jgi:hypothetical protein
LRRREGEREEEEEDGRVERWMVGEEWTKDADTIRGPFPIPQIFHCLDLFFIFFSLSLSY